MATPERDPVYTNDANRTVYARESNGTGWFVGIIVVLALLAIGYLVFSANSGPSTAVDTSTGAPAITDSTTAPAPMTEAPATETAPAPMTEAPATPAPEAAPATPAAPAADAAPATPAPSTDATTPAPTSP